jgi:hypothetical protein
MTDVRDADVWYVCNWLQSYIRHTENSLLDLSIAYVEDLTVEDVDAMVLRDVQRRHPDRRYLLEHVRNWPVTHQLKLVIGSLSIHSTAPQNAQVRQVMVAEIERSRPRSGPPGPKPFQIRYPPPGPGTRALHLSALLSRLQNTDSHGK